MTRVVLDKELNELDAQVMHLDSLVEHALAQALGALETGDREKAEAVIASDDAIDDLHIAIQEHTFRVTILQQPLAGRDMRYLTSMLPITIDLERIGDEAEGIARLMIRMMPFYDAGESPIEESSTNSPGGEGKTELLTEALLMRSLLDLGQQVRSLLQRTMQAFVSRDAQAARFLWREDTSVKRYYYSTRRDLMTMLEGPQAIPALQRDPYILQRVTFMLWIAHELQRVADHCTNICERIVFIVEGETDIRPSPGQ
jgi:phosphate transport system protein